ncbi:hypothetical protein C8E97_1616 [Saccharothrix australiensis]|uniref:Uncharacterized protein n=1 Tax=Saccharothrix australiensis TaxID=2072 RepID=A0A495VZN2_9PSEU|nr:hypothetical protein C8E97_1616 [Saccharothrix australiensis]
MSRVSVHGGRPSSLCFHATVWKIPNVFATPVVMPQGGGVA